MHDHSGVVESNSTEEVFFYWSSPTATLWLGDGEARVRWWNTHECWPSSPGVRRCCWQKGSPKWIDASLSSPHQPQQLPRLQFHQTQKDTEREEVENMTRGNKTECWLAHLFFLFREGFFMDSFMTCDTLYLSGIQTRISAKEEISLC